MGTDYSVKLVYGASLNPEHSKAFSGLEYSTEYSSFSQFLDGWVSQDVLLYASGSFNVLFQSQPAWGLTSLDNYLHEYGNTYSWNEKYYCVGISVMEDQFFEQKELSIHDIQKLQDEYLRVRDCFEALFGIDLPKQGEFCICSLVY